MISHASILYTSRRTWIYVFIGLFIVGFAFLFFRGSETADSPEAEILPAVQLESVSALQQSQARVQSVGEVESLAEVSLRSQLGTKVSRVSVELGQRVEAGQVLVELEAKELDAQLAQAAAGIARMQSAVSQQYAGATDQQVAQARAAVAAAQAGLEQSETALVQARSAGDVSVHSAEIALAAAESGRRNTADSSDQSLVGARESLMNALRSALLSGENALIILTDVQLRYFNCTNDELCIRISSTKAQAVSELLGGVNAGMWTNTALADLQGGVSGRIDALSVSTTDDELLRLSKDARRALTSVQETLSAARGAFDSYLAQGMTQAEKGSFDGARGSLEAAVATLTQTEQGFEQARIGKTSGLDATDSAVQQARQALEAARVQAASGIASAGSLVQIQKAAVAQAQAALDLLLADPRAVDVAGLRAGVSEAQASYALIAANREKATIRAPFAGEVGSLPVEVGQLVNPGELLATVVNNEGIQVRTYVNERDRSRIELGNLVVINERIEGVVTNIAPSLDAQTRKIEVLVAVTGEQAPLTIGSFADVSFVVEVKEGGVVYVPFSSVRTSSAQNVVFTVDADGVVLERPVQIGRIFGESVEVLSGLTLEDQILVSVRGRRAGERVQIVQ